MITDHQIVITLGQFPGSCGSKYLVRKGSDYLTPRSEGVVEGGGA
jgi:hypothetical protein